nr:hypothetical protein [Hyella patelloides]
MPIEKLGITNATVLAFSANSPQSWSCSSLNPVVPTTALTP